MLLRSLFATRPRIPRISEWTACEESLQFLSLSVFTGGVHRRVFEVAVGLATSADADPGLLMLPAAEIQEPVQRARSKGVDAVDGLTWHQLAGSRIRYVRDRVMSSEHDFTCVLLGLLIGILSESHTHPTTYTVTILILNAVVVGLMLWPFCMICH